MSSTIAKRLHNLSPGVVLAPKNRTRTLTIILAVLLAVVPLLLLVRLLMVNAVNVPFWDQWELPTLFSNYFQHHLTFGDFFAQHNEHRILFPRLIMFALAKMTHWNTLYEVATNVILAIISYVFLFKIIRRTFQSWWLVAGAAVITSLIIFSPIQWENWLWGWQIQWFLNVAAVVVGLWALSTWQPKRRYLKLVVAIVACVVATYSLAAGLLSWLVLFPLVVMNKELRRYWWVWVVAAVLTVGSHYIGYVQPTYPPKESIAHHPILFAKYVAVYLSRPVLLDFLFAWQTAAALAITTVATGVLYWFNARKAWPQILPWACLMAYGVVAAVSTATGRLGLGIEQAYSNRYITISGLFLLGLIMIILKTIEVVKIRRMGWVSVVQGALLVLVIPMVMMVSLNYFKGISQMRAQHNHLVLVQQCAHSAQSPDDPCLTLLYPNGHVVWGRLLLMRSVHWGGL